MVIIMALQATHKTPIIWRLKVTVPPWHFFGPQLSLSFAPIFSCLLRRFDSFTHTLTYTQMELKPPTHFILQECLWTSRIMLEVVLWHCQLPFYFIFLILKWNGRRSCRNPAEILGHHEVPTDHFDNLHFRRVTSRICKPLTLWMVWITPYFPVNIILSFKAEK